MDAVKDALDKIKCSGFGTYCNSVSYGDHMTKDITMGECRYCLKNICEKCRMRPDGDKDFEKIDSICADCWFRILKRYKPDNIDKGYIEKYMNEIKNYELDTNEINYKKIEKYLCKHYDPEHKRVYLGIDPENKESYPKYSEDDVPEKCFKCYLNGCFYGTGNTFYKDILNEKYMELFEDEKEPEALEEPEYYFDYPKEKNTDEDDAYDEYFKSNWGYDGIEYDCDYITKEEFDNLCVNCRWDTYCSIEEHKKMIQKYKCAGFDCDYAICEQCIDSYTNAGSCLFCGEFICEECQMRPDGYGFENDDCICYNCWFNILKKIKPDYIDKKFIKDYLSDIKDTGLIKYEEGGYSKVKKYLCDHYSKEVFTIPRKKFTDKDLENVKNHCFKCYLNACIYGGYYRYFRETLTNRYKELFE